VDAVQAVEVDGGRDAVQTRETDRKGDHAGPGGGQGGEHAGQLGDEGSPPAQTALEDKVPRVLLLCSC